LASRFAGSSSFGSARLIYYLGAVDNWINLSPKVPTFDNSIRIDNSANYAYQASATNMRGFVQNVRNGNNFAVINNELRWPFVKYFANYPISSNFWSSLQLVGFFDIGSAWAGLSPYSGKNAYDYDIIPDSTKSNNAKSNLIVKLQSNRSPIVYGYGFGARVQLLGYFIRLDWAWGVENKVILPPVFYLSFSLDF
jgi:outer membrane protein assembly factor BamA